MVMPDIRYSANRNRYFYVQEGRESATGRFSSLLDVEIPIPVGINCNFLLKPVKELVNWFSPLAGLFSFPETEDYNFIILTAF